MKLKTITSFAIVGVAFVYFLVADGQAKEDQGCWAAYCEAFENHYYEEFSSREKADAAATEHDKNAHQGRKFAKTTYVGEHCP